MARHWHFKKALPEIPPVLPGLQREESFWGFAVEGSTFPPFGNEEGRGIYGFSKC
jgi:hypothetical protein